MPRSDTHAFTFAMNGRDAYAASNGAGGVCLMLASNNVHIGFSLTAKEARDMSNALLQAATAAERVEAA